MIVGNNLEYDWSNYNITVNYGDKCIIFNALSGALFEVPVELYEEVKKSSDENIPNLKEHTKENFDLLKKGRFIKNKNLDEYNLLKFRYNKGVFSNVYNLIINPTLECNFNCWYCYEKHTKGKISDKVKNNVLKFVDKLIENKISGIDLSWFGGEPLLCFDEVYEISRDIKNKCEEHNINFSNSVTTNGYLIDEGMIDKLKEIELNRYQITLDGTREIHNKNRFVEEGKGTYDTILKNMDILCQKIPDANITLRINYSNKIFPGIYEVLENDIPKSIRKQIKVSFHRIWQTCSKEEPIGELLQNKYIELEKCGYMFPNEDFQLYRGCVCYADRFNQALINYDGNVFKCTARDFQPENRAGVLNDKGEIEWNEEEVNRFACFSFDNETCKKCRILPLCMGTCSQKFKENNYKFSEQMCILNIGSSPEQFIINRYKSLCYKNKNTP